MAVGIGRGKSKKKSTGDKPFRVPSSMTKKGAVGEEKPKRSPVFKKQIEEAKKAAEGDDLTKELKRLQVERAKLEKAEQEILRQMTERKLNTSITNLNDLVRSKINAAESPEDRAKLNAALEKAIAILSEGF
jgi:hypothetical protein